MIKKLPSKDSIRMCSIAECLPATWGSLASKAQHCTLTHMSEKKPQALEILIHYISDREICVLEIERTVTTQ